ncbi:UDP pyrophosphate synthase [Pseudothermotoga hypogea DSM 11164 = NBRC 106472]|uniref:Isoprenyl transferase n=2 Tax=Pseudothermotoga hypogea TaxID=57487 RepID=A0A0X1KQ88_9THEM|nr:MULTISPECIES: polyprenyl diphosphate synthase [Pseudothermotoga]AJC73370.1 UDP pyrophosphate synthase [Pseudothermotoga hypogea DSM 11164 = NBRC 106472]MDI6863878.1 polyprenyl diphosphate synthase [Pseudothermotoga sp.]
MRPTHVAIIMDGNGRWAQRRGLPRIEGHRRGALKAEKVVEWAAELSIKYVTFYAFSTENWKRPREEVEYLFSLLLKLLRQKLKKMLEKGVRIRFIGAIEDLPKEVVEFCRECEEKTRHNDRIHAILALNYGGRREIVDAFNKAIENGITRLDEAQLRNWLYLPDVPDPDLVIRTSGELRISNFLLWQIAYSELYFTKVLWPDFTKQDFLRAIEDYERRQRRFGGL